MHSLLYQYFSRIFFLENRPDFLSVFFLKQEGVAGLSNPASFSDLQGPILTFILLDSAKLRKKKKIFGNSGF